MIEESGTKIPFTKIKVPTINFLALTECIYETEILIRGMSIEDTLLWESLDIKKCKGGETTGHGGPEQAQRPEGPEPKKQLPPPPRPHKLLNRNRQRHQQQESDVGLKEEVSKAVVIHPPQHPAQGQATDQHSNDRPPAMPPKALQDFRVCNSPPCAPTPPSGTCEPA